MSQPNVVLIMTDQQQAGLCRREGFGLDTTPFLDRLARDGVSFSRAYTSSPICTPARISLFTGRYPSAHEVKENYPGLKAPNFPDPWIVRKEEVRYSRDLFDLFEQHGYRRALVGKNHAHLDNDNFDYVRSYHHRGGFYDDITEREVAFDQWVSSRPYGVAMEANPFPAELEIPRRMVSAAIDWVDANQEEPFALWLSFPEPHNPYRVPEPYFSLFGGDNYLAPQTGKEDLLCKNERWQRMYELFSHYQQDAVLEDILYRGRRNYLGMLRFLDDQIARFVTHLQNRGLGENTIIVFLADHGDLAGEYGFLRKGLELCEFLTRIPLLFAGGPVAQRPPVEDLFVNIVDLLPTLCEACGFEVPKGVQGKSFWPILSGQQRALPGFESAYSEWGTGKPALTPTEFEDLKARFYQRRGYNELNPYSLSGSTRMVRKGKWKLVYSWEGQGELYDLNADPYELSNLYHDARRGAVRQEMLEELARWSQRVEQTGAILSR